MEGNTMDLESIKRKEHKISKTRNNISTTYNDYKEFEGRKYTGMRVGGVHHWYYEKGEWKESVLLLAISLVICAQGFSPLTVTLSSKSIESVLSRFVRELMNIRYY
jgi:hypothetical protein